MSKVAPKRLSPAAERTPFTSPFVVAVDSKEQLPHAFAGMYTDGGIARRRPLVVPTVRKHLRIGDTLFSYDYGIDGLEGVVGVERKSAADLYGTISQGRPRFASKLSRLCSFHNPTTTFRYFAVIVEAELSTLLLTPPPRAELPPKNLWRTIMCWMQEFRGVHWIFCPDRRFAEVATYRVLERFYKVRQREKTRLDRKRYGMESTKEKV